MQAEAGRITGEALPAPLFARHAARLSHISVSLDPDGILRTIHLRGGFGLARHDFSPLAALRVADPGGWPDTRPLPGQHDPRKSVSANRWIQDAWYHIPFAGPPGHFRAFSYVDVLTMTDSEMRAAFNGRFVLVGATAPSLADAYPTPGSGRNSRAMPGIEIQANVLQGLMEGTEIRIAGVWASVGLSIGFLLMVMAAFPLFAPRWSLTLAFGIALASVVVSAAMFEFLHWWWSPAVTFLVVLLAYPLWSWRKLEATQKFLDDELSRLDREPNVVPILAAQRREASAGDGFPLPGLIENRIATVQAAAERLRSMNRFIAESVESLPDPTLVTNSDGLVLLANSSADRIFKARRLRADPASGRIPDMPLEGRSIVDLLGKFSPPGGAPWRATWVDAYEETRTVSLESKFEDGREFLIRIAPLFSTRGPQIGSIVTLVDVSPLRESERRRDEALRFLSHDMRAPQASILTLLSMYQDDPQGTPIDKLTARIEKYARRTLNLADEFLRLAKAERARSEDFEPLDLREIALDAVDAAWSAAQAKSIKIELTGCEGAMTKGDRDLVTRVLINLLSNAIKYSPPSTCVTLHIFEHGGDWHLQVVDQGYGIATENLPMVFSRFQRFRHAAQPEEEGIGLGLVFVKTVMERHAGQVRVTSKVASAADPSQGTCFELTFPRLNAAGEV
jgi:signal transduction histidine kinase